VRCRDLLIAPLPEGVQNNAKIFASDCHKLAARATCPGSSHEGGHRHVEYQFARTGARENLDAGHALDIQNNIHL
jgi:hypothetical protein